MNLIEARLKRIEKVLMNINKTGGRGVQKTIQMNAKTRELRNLIDLIKDTQKMIEEIDDLPLQQEYMRNLDLFEFARRDLLFPKIILCEC